MPQQEEQQQENIKPQKRRGRPTGLRKGPDGKWYKPGDGGQLPQKPIETKEVKPNKKRGKRSKHHIINYDSDDGPSHEDLVALEEELSLSDDFKEKIREFKEDHDNSDILITDWLDFPDHIRMRQIVTYPEWGLDNKELIDKPLVSTKYVTDKFREYSALFGYTTNQMVLRPIESFLEDTCKVFNNGMECDGAKKPLGIFFSYLQNVKPYTLYYLYTVSDNENYSTPIGIIFRDQPFKNQVIVEEDLKTGKLEIIKYLKSTSGFYIIHPSSVATTPDEFMDYFHETTVFTSLQYFITEDDINFTGIGIDETTNLYWGWQNHKVDESSPTYLTSYESLVNSSKQLFGVVNDSDEELDVEENVDDIDDINDINETEYDDDEYDNSLASNKHISYLDTDIDDYYDNLIDKPSVKTRRPLTDDDIYYTGTNKDKRDFENLSDGGFRKTNHGLSDDNGFDNYQDD